MARILVAENDETGLRALSWLLRERGHAVTTVATARDVAAALPGAACDAVLIDAPYPGSDALTLVQHLRETPASRDLPILVVTVLPPDGLFEQALAFEGVDVMRKPLRVSELLARLERLLRGRPDRHRSVAHQDADINQLKLQLPEDHVVESIGAPLPAAGGDDDVHRQLEEMRAENQRLELLSQVDPLTSLLNRRALASRLSTEMERVRRYDTHLSLLMVDLDYFKRINDVHGHLVGDDVLMGVADLFQRIVRSVDFVARYGGEEFVIVLPETPLDGADRFAERVRDAVASERFETEAGTLQLTVSIGAAVFPAAGVESVDDLIAAADAALYRAKAEGRNRVASAPGAVTTP